MENKHGGIFRLELLNDNFKYFIEELPKHIKEFNISDREYILFSLDGIINNRIYFNSMSKDKIMPNNNLMSLLESKYGSFANFKNEFKKSALSIKEFGYTFLVITGNQLEIIDLKNQDNPYI